MTHACDDEDCVTRTRINRCPIADMDGNVRVASKILRSSCRKLRIDLTGQDVTSWRTISAMIAE